MSQCRRFRGGYSAPILGASGWAHIQMGTIHMKVIITSAEEGGYVFGAVCLSVCLSVCLFVCLSVGLLANL